MGIVYWSPLSIFVSPNKDKELEGGPKFMFLFCLFGGGGALKILLVLRGGQRKNIITVEFLLTVSPCTINNEQSLSLYCITEKVFGSHFCSVFSIY
jgi:hypothetical protein